MLAHTYTVIYYSSCNKRFSADLAKLLEANHLASRASRFSPSSGRDCKESANRTDSKLSRLRPANSFACGSTVGHLDRPTHAAGHNSVRTWTRIRPRWARLPFREHRTHRRRILAPHSLRNRYIE